MTDYDWGFTRIRTSPFSALTALNNAFYNQGNDMYVVNTLAEAIGRMEEIEDDNEGLE